MHNIIHESLSRQEKALCLLRDLLEEEYSSLLSRDTDAVVSLEFSVQELIRHLAVEKTFVIKRLGGMRAAEYASMLPEDMAAMLLETLRHMKEKAPKIPVILLTGHACMGVAVQGLDLGAYDYMLKPVAISELIIKMEEAARSAM